MKKKVLAIMCDAGPGNNMVGPIKLLKQNPDLDVIVLSEGPSQRAFQRESVEYKTLDHYNIKDLICFSDGSREVNPNYVLEILEKESPDLVFTGISAVPLLERYFLYFANEKGIPTVSIIDGFDFSSVKQTDTNIDENYRFRPNLVLVADKNMQNVMIKEGFNPESVVITGLPYYDNLAVLKGEFSEDDKSKVKVWNDLGITDRDYVITFISQALYNAISKGAVKDHGYNELTVLSALENSLVNLTGFIKNLCLLVKLHPSEDPNMTRTVIEGKYIKVILDKDYNTRKAILASNLVGGMFSTAMMEAAYLDLDLFSAKPGFIINEETEFLMSPLGYAIPSNDRQITNKIGLSIPIYRRENLESHLYTAISNTLIHNQLRKRRLQLSLDGKATERVVNIIYDALNK